MKEFITNMLASFIDTITDNAMLNGAIKAITTNDYGILDVGGFVNTICSAMSVIGFSVCALFFLMSLMDLSMSDRFSIETFAKHFINLAIGCFGVINAFYFTRFGWGLSEWISDLLGGQTELAPYVCQVCIDTGKATNCGKISHLFEGKIDLTGSGLTMIFLALIFLAIGLLALIANIIAIIAIYIAGFSRLIEMGLRACFMPIGLAFMTDDGWKGAGGRYLKKFCALCCQGPAYLLLGKIHSNLIANVLSGLLQNVAGSTIGGTFAAVGNLLSVIGILLAGTFALVAMIFKAGGIVNDVFGV